MKKIVAILLVVALMSAMFVVPAHAHEVEETEIMPRARFCQECSGPCRSATSQSNVVWNETVHGCTNKPGVTHKHGYYYIYSYYVCTSTGCPAYNSTWQYTTSTKYSVCAYD